LAEEHPTIDANLKAGLLSAYPLPPVYDAESKFQRLLEALAQVKLDGQGENYLPD
jgi:hypothetical protein